MDGDTLFSHITNKKQNSYRFHPLQTSYSTIEQIRNDAKEEGYKR
jgi:hypothetical protein